MAHRRTLTPKIVAPDMTATLGLLLFVTGCLILIWMFEFARAAERQKLPRDMLARPLADSVDEEIMIDLFYDGSMGAGGSVAPKLRLAGQTYSAERFADALQNERKQLEARRGLRAIERTRIVVRADRAVPTGQVQGLVRTCQEQGFLHFSLRPSDASPSEGGIFPSIDGQSNGTSPALRGVPLPVTLPPGGPVNLDWPAPEGLPNRSDAGGLPPWGNPPPSGTGSLPATRPVNGLPDGNSPGSGGATPIDPAFDPAFGTAPPVGPPGK